MKLTIDDKTESTVRLYLDQSPSDGHVGLYAEENGRAYCLLVFKPNGKVLRTYSTRPALGDFNFDATGRLIIE